MGRDGRRDGEPWCAILAVYALDSVSSHHRTFNLIALSDWVKANEEDMQVILRFNDKDEFSVTLGEKVWIQKPQKYHARSLGMLRAKYAEIADKRDLDLILAAAGCLAGLRA